MAKSPARQTVTQVQGNKDSVAIGIYQSGLPDPVVIEAYERLHPGAVGRVLDMAEKEQDHEQKIELLECRHKIISHSMGMWFGFAACFIALAGGIIFILFDKNTEGWVALVSSLVFVFIAFIKGKT